MLLVKTSTPPTSNQRFIWANGRMVLKPEYRAWKFKTAGEVKQQLPSNYTTITAPVIVVVSVTHPDRRKRDIDNPLKPLNDVLKEAGVIADDSQIKRQYVYDRGVNKHDAGLRVLVYEASNPIAQMFDVMEQQFTNDVIKCTEDKGDASQCMSLSLHKQISLT